MAKDNFAGTPDELPYDEYLQQMQAQQEAENAAAQEAAQSNAPRSISEEGDFQPEQFSDTGGYDEYLSSQSGASGSAALSGSDKQSDHKQTQDIEDNPGKASQGASSSETLSEGSSGSLLSTGEGAAEGARNATAGEAVTGVGTKMVEGVKGMLGNLTNGLKSMFLNMTGGIGQLAQTLHVSAKALTFAIALLGGGSISFLGITLFGDTPWENYIAPVDCHVRAVYTVEYTNNEIYTPVTRSAMDGNAQTLYKAFSNKNLINGIIGFEYVVGDKDTDPYYDERPRTHVNPGSAAGYKYVGLEPDPDDIDLSTDEPRIKPTWIYDPYMGQTRWDHGPATLKDTDDGATFYNVLPGGSDRTASENVHGANVATRITTGLLPGLSDNRKWFDKGFTDEAILGMILNAEEESGVNPGCWEGMPACFYYLQVEGNVIPTDVSSGGSVTGGKNIVMATTHHRNWSKYVLALKEWWAAQSITITLGSSSTYHYINRWGEETDIDGELLYYPGVGLWQWTGARAYAMQEWNNMLIGLSDATLDTSNDAMYSINSQIYYELFENYGTWDGTVNKPVDNSGQERVAVDVDKNPLKDTVDNNRVSLIDWGETDRVIYTETYYVNIPNRPGAGTEQIYSRYRTATHTFTGIREVSYDAEGNGEVSTNHDNLVRPQFDYVYTVATQRGTYKGITLTDDGSGDLRLVNIQRLGELYEIMLSHPKRPDCSMCNMCGGGCVHTPWESHTTPECSCEDCDCEVANLPDNPYHDNCVPMDCHPYWCYHQCQLDSETNIRNMIKYLMTTWRDENGEVWWYGLTEADLMDVGRHNSDEFSCGDMLYKNIVENGTNDAGVSYPESVVKKLSADYNLSVYYVTWYYDVSVEVQAQFSDGTVMHDVDNMNNSGGGILNGNADRPDNMSYVGGPSSATQAGDQIIYESTSEAVTGFVPGKSVFGEDKAINHPGTDTGPNGYSATYHDAWMKGTVDTFSEKELHVYMGRAHSSKTDAWSNYGSSEFPSATDGTVALDTIPSTHIGWNLDIFDRWWNLEDTELGLHNAKFPYGEGSAVEFIDRYYRMRLTGYMSGDVLLASDIISPMGTGLADWDDAVDGSLATPNASKPNFITEFVGTAGRTYPNHPVEPMIADLGGGGSDESPLTDSSGDDLASAASSAYNAWQDAIANGGTAREIAAAQDAYNSAQTAYDTAQAAAADNADIDQIAAAKGIWGATDYKYVRNFSDDLMWWAEARAIAQVSRILAREYTMVWEGMGRSPFVDTHSKYGSAVHYAVQMITDRWKPDKNAAKSVMDLWYEDMSNAPLQTWWSSFYRNYCGSGNIGFGGIAQCATSWAWLQGHPETATVHEPGAGTLGGGQYLKTYCTELYVEVKTILNDIPLVEPIPNLYSSCDRGVCTAVHASGADDDFPWGAAVGQLEYATSSSKWEDLGVVTSFSNLEPGDLLLSSHHVVVFTGGEFAEEKWPSEISAGAADNGIVHSSLSASLDSSRGPRFDINGESYIVSSGDFHAFRLVGDPDENSPCRTAILAEESRLAACDDGSF